jgi:fructokinase
MNRTPVVVGLGEVLWDVFPDGARFGGAPANFSCCIKSLAQERIRSYVVSGVGRDALGDRALTSLTNKEVDVSYLARSDFPTGQVHVRIDADGHASYEFQSNCAWDNFVWSDSLEHLAKNTDVVCFGTLGQRNDHARNTIRRFLATVPSTALRIFDINLRPPFVDDALILETMKFANVLKLNDSELPVLDRLLALAGTENERLQQIAKRFSLDVVALTLGPNGALLVKGNETNRFAGIKTKVADTVGAGDAFTATLALGLLHKAELGRINAIACEVAAYVCSQSGATPDLPSRFCGMFVEGAV